jgi:hypothetical protein
MNLLLLLSSLLRLLFRLSLLRLCFLFLLYLWLSLGLLLLLRFLFGFLLLDDRVELSHFSSRLLLEESLHFFQLDGTRFISIKEVEEVAPVGLVHEYVTVLKTFSQLSGFNCSAPVDIDNYKELLKGYSTAEDDIFYLADQLFLPHGTILMPVLKDSFELLQS